MKKVRVLVLLHKYSVAPAITVRKENAYLLDMY